MEASRRWVLHRHAIHTPLQGNPVRNLLKKLRIHENRHSIGGAEARPRAADVDRQRFLPGAPRPHPKAAEEGRSRLKAHQEAADGAIDSKSGAKDSIDEHSVAREKAEPLGLGLRRGRPVPKSHEVTTEWADA